MALIVEDGSVVAGAESYVSVADCTIYLTNRGKGEDWEDVDDLQEAALRRATDFLTQMYRARWKGYRKDGAQVLDWPRSWVYLEPFTHGIVGTYPYLVPDTIVPTEVKNACCELALLDAGVNALIPTQKQGKSSVKVGPIDVVYDINSSQQPQYNAIEMILGPYITGGGANVPLIRS